MQKANIWSKYCNVLQKLLEEGFFVFLKQSKTKKKNESSQQESESFGTKYARMDQVKLVEQTL